MIIYNSTYLVSPTKTNCWLLWIKETHIPAMLESGYFTEPQIVKVLGHDNEHGSPYSVQFRVKDQATLDEWRVKQEVELLSSISKEFGEEVLPFSTVLEIIK